MHTQAVLFDLDGTLADTLPLIIQTYRKVFRDLEIPWGNDDVLKLIGMPLVEIAGHFTEHNESRFVELYQHYYGLDLDSLTRPFPGTCENLQRLKSLGLKLGVVTSKGRTPTMRTLSQTQMDYLMDVVVTAHDVVKPKPDAEPLLKALDMLEIPADRSIFIGDSYFDILTGQRAGARVLGVTWGLESREELEKLAPDGLLDNWEEIIQYL